MEGTITQLLNDWSQGNKEALDTLVAKMYPELHRIAHNCLHREHPNNTLQTSALVNELYIRFAGWEPLDWKNRAHFLGVTAKLLRNILVDFARRRLTERRGRDFQRISLTEAAQFLETPDLDLLALNDALSGLEKIDPGLSQIIEYRYFGGLTCEETGEILGLSASTINREEKAAKLWLLRELNSR